MSEPVNATPFDPAISAIAGVPTHEAAAVRRPPTSLQ